ncbi:hypothetical protein [Caldisericum sp.]|uniref:hypothetical protein n=1 Tax=Caldisericum sp. TaxID=2499687 RepID=UPI003D12EF6E
MAFLELEGQGRTLQGYLVKGAISRDGSFEYPEVARCVAMVDKYVYRFDCGEDVFIASEIFGVYAVVQGGLVSGFYWDFLEDPEMQDYLDRYGSLEAFLENYYMKEEGFLNRDFYNPEEGFFLTGKINQGRCEPPKVQRCFTYSDGTFMKFSLSDDEALITFDPSGIIIDGSISLYWDFLWMDHYEDFSKFDKDYLKEKVLSYSKIKI